MSIEQIKTVGADLAELQINSSEPSVIVVFGKPGVGKTSIANEIASRMGARALSSDEFRRKRFPNLQYEEEQSSAAMWDMITEAHGLFRRGEAQVVLDATFLKRKYRVNARRLAEKYGKKIIWVEVISDQTDPMTGNIDGQLVSRAIDEPNEIEQKIVIDNSVRSENKDELIKSLVDRIMISGNN